MTEKVCGTCYWHHNCKDDWVCVNDASENCADYTDDEHTCEEWEGLK